MDIDAKALRPNGTGKGSVQARETHQPEFDTPAVGGVGGVTSMLFSLARYADETPAWNPLFPLYRDAYLRTFWKSEPIMSGAVYSLTARMKALDSEITGLPRAKKYAQEVVKDCENGKGLRSLMGKFFTDWLTQDNGAFIELVGSGRSDKPLKGALQYPYMLNMDSATVWRTLDPEFPVLYINPITGQYRALHYSRVLLSASMEQPDELARNVGFCPVSRALKYAQFMRDVLTFKSEKVGGRFTRGIVYGNGINPTVFRGAMQAARGDAVDEQFLVYRGLPVLLRQGPEPIQMNVLDLARIPDGFDTEKDMTLYVYALALAFGVDAREFWTATQSGATKADATVSHLKAQGKGIGDMIQTFTSVMRLALPDSVNFAFDFTDDEQDKLKAEINAMNADTLVKLTTTGILTPIEARAMAVQQKLVDMEALQSIAPNVAESMPVNENTIDVEQQSDTPEQSANPLPSSDVEGNPPVEYQVREKALPTIQRNFEDAMNGVLANETRDKFVSDMQALVRNYGLQAYFEGIGATSERPQLTQEDIAAIRETYAAQVPYINSAADVLYANKETGNPIAWWNMSIMPFYYAGLARVNAHKRYKWRLGRTEQHCPDCLRLNGQVHTLRAWQERKLTPPTSETECKGYRCDCTLEETTESEVGAW